MALPERDNTPPLLIQLRNELEMLDRKIEMADANENTIERTTTLERLGEERDCLMTEIAAISQQDNEHT